MIVSAGIDQTTSSMRPEYAKSGRYTARGLDCRNQNAKARIATIVGTTIASMIATESIRIVASAAPIGPCGSRIFIAAPENGTATNGEAARRFHRQMQAASRHSILLRKRVGCQPQAGASCNTLTCRFLEPAGTAQTHHPAGALASRHNSYTRKR